MELFAKDELEVDRLFAAASSQFEQAYNTSKAIAAVESRRRGSLTRKWAGPLGACVRVWLEL